MGTIRVMWREAQLCSGGQFQRSRPGSLVHERNAANLDVIRCRRRRLKQAKQRQCRLCCRMEASFDSLVHDRGAGQATGQVTGQACRYVRHKPVEATVTVAPVVFMSPRESTTATCSGRDPEMVGVYENVLELPCCFSTPDQYHL